MTIDTSRSTWNHRTGETTTDENPKASRLQQSCHMHPAIADWEKELRDGKRTPTTLDDLWRAACEATIAQELHAQNMHESAKSCEQEASRLLKSYQTEMKRMRHARDGFEYL